jgi:hypothetical protein
MKINSNPLAGMSDDDDEADGTTRNEKETALNSGNIQEVAHGSFGSNNNHNNLTIGVSQPDSCVLFHQHHYSQQFSQPPPYMQGWSPHVDM